ncbi:hypothetical protein [Novosphingobium sp. BW1]|uniref:hypothetical protein n=1 Tax=Novosphingobium sp. BW1 TaxID=2592621 RepID=UPI0013969A56|nr:hypothetical protein [Novosphingobium sp. BW1]
MRLKGLEQRAEIAKGDGAASTGMRLEPRLATTKGGSGKNEMHALAGGDEPLDTCLWTGITKASIDFSTPTLPPALVGTVEQVADAMMEYYRLGISGYLLRGFDLFGDIAEHGRELIPLLRSKAAQIDMVSAGDLSDVV